MPRPFVGVSMVMSFLMSMVSQGHFFGKVRLIPDVQLYDGKGRLKTTATFVTSLL